MPSQRSTATIRKTLNVDVLGVGRVGLAMNLTGLEHFIEDVQAWIRSNTSVSDRTLQTADYALLLQEMKEQAEGAPVSVGNAIPNEIKKGDADVDPVDAELEELPYRTPVEGPAGRPWLDRAAHHGIAGEILDYVSSDVEADPAGILATMLSAFSCMVGHDRVARGPVKQHINVWHILIGETGDGRKGTAADRAMEVMRRVSSDFFKSNTTSSLSSGEGLIYSVRDGMDGDEIARREENGQKVDYGVEDKRLLVQSSEFATIMQKTQGSTLGPVLRDAWDGKSLNIHSMDAEVASNPHITVLGHVTPQEFADRQKSSEMAGGTWNRFLPIFVHKPHEIPWPEEPEGWDEELAEFADRLRTAAFKAGSQGAVVEFSREAQIFYRKEVYPQYADASGDSETMKQFTQRRLPHLVRVAGTYALMNGRSLVSLGDLKAAKAVVDYAIESARFVLASHTPGGRSAAQSAEAREARDKQIMHDALKAAGEEGVGKSVLQQEILGYRRKKAEIESFANDLGAVIVKLPSTGGRPSERVYHPDHAPVTTTATVGKARTPGDNANK
ncbi:hypothetical protein ABZ714_13300 [Streptomyces sp. NPDC006798]|uniref:DUF3987 domain-containing protein n=1 Tax=Streptomyces sp. NPDC006798 TaxID=3155462 RepID=UPI0033FBFF3A